MLQNKDFTIENSINISRGLTADLDRVTSFTYIGEDIMPSLPKKIDDSNHVEWNEGCTWYPFAEEESGRKIPDDIIETAARLAKFMGNFIVLRCFYVNTTYNKQVIIKDFVFYPNAKISGIEATATIR